MLWVSDWISSSYSNEINEFISFVDYSKDNCRSCLNFAYREITRNMVGALLKLHQTKTKTNFSIIRVLNDYYYSYAGISGAHRQQTKKLALVL